MRWIRIFAARLRSLCRRDRLERELEAELRFHIDRQIAENLRSGMSPGAARLSAVRSTGNVTTIKEHCRDSLGLRLIDELRRDVRYASRTLRKNPGYTTVAVLTLALGIGANTAIFQLIDAVRLRRLPVQRPSELAEVRIAGGHRLWGLIEGPNGQLTYPLWQQIREHQRAFSGVFAWGTAPFVVGTGRDGRPASGMWVSGDAFEVLGIAPAPADFSRLETMSGVARRRPSSVTRSGRRSLAATQRPLVGR